MAAVASRGVCISGLVMDEFRVFVKLRPFVGYQWLCSAGARVRRCFRRLEMRSFGLLECDPQLAEFRYETSHLRVFRDSLQTNRNLLASSFRQVRIDHWERFNEIADQSLQFGVLIGISLSQRLDATGYDSRQPLLHLFESLHSHGVRRIVLVKSWYELVHELQHYDAGVKLHSHQPIARTWTILFSN